MKAVLMAGGMGKRLHPLTVNRPKPLVLICGKPIMEHVLIWLKKHGIDEIIVLLYHQPEQIKEYFKDGSCFGVKLEYIEAKEDFGTAGAVKLAQESLEDDFLVLSADVICDFDLSSIIQFHKKKKARATIALTRVKNPLQYGIVITEPDGRIINFLEKPSWAEVFSDTVNTGIYVLQKEALEAVPENKLFDFSSDLFPLFLKEGKNIYGCVCRGYWKDIGNLLEYKNAHADILKGKSLVEEASFVAEEAVISNSYVGKRCNIGKGTRIINSVVWDDVDIGKECILKDTVVADGCVLKERIALEEGCVLGSGCVVYPDTRLLPFIKVWPNKKISEGSTVNRNMVWREKWSNAIFGAYGVTGKCNVEITPEFAAKLGSAYGAMLGKGSTVVSSMDGHKASRMIYRALIAGVLSSGVNVSNIEIVPIPINRYVLKSLSSKGGIHVRKSPFDNEVIDIKFFDSNGMDLSGTKEKSIERLFWGEDYLRAGIEDTGELSFPFCRVAEEYKEGVMHFIDTAAVKKRGFKIVIDYAFGSASQIFPSILGDLGCETVAINANIDENKLTKSKEDFDRYLNQLSQIVVTLKADLGIMFDSGAEKLFLVDEKGKILDGEEALAFVSSLVLMTDKPRKIAAPVNTSSVVDILASKSGSQVVRTKTSFRYMMESASTDGVGFFGEPLGGYIFPAFQPYFDAMLATAKILEMLARSAKTASQITSSIPKTFLYKKKIDCENELKGKTIRILIEENKALKLDMTDGVKISFKDGWVLIHAHPDKAEIHVLSESDGQSKSELQANKYSERIKEILRAEG
jgi:mannose-1-phosphate guanylyltransferase/phosphomannomutase